MAVRKAEWQNKYIAKTYDRINLTVPKGQKEVIQETAKNHGLSVNGWINSLIDAALEQESCKGDGFHIQSASKNTAE